MTTQAEIIASIQSRADAVGVPVYILCVKAGVAPSTFYRWRSGSDATFSKINKLTSVLAELEAEKAA